MVAEIVGPPCHKTQSRVQGWLDRHICPHIGATPITVPRDILGALLRINARGAHDSARRVLGYCGQIFEYAMLREAVEVDIKARPYRALEEPQRKYYAAITDPARLHFFYAPSILTPPKCALR